MENFIKIGGEANEKNLKMIESTILKIMQDRNTENKTKQVALKVFREIMIKVGVAENTMITNCTFMSGKEKG